MEVSQLSFLVLPEMVRVADDLFERVKKIRAETRAVGRNTPMMGREKARPLREREPASASRLRRGGRQRKTLEGSLVSRTVGLGKVLEGEPCDEHGSSALVVAPEGEVSY